MKIPVAEILLQTKVIMYVEYPKQKHLIRHIYTN